MDHTDRSNVDLSRNMTLILCSERPSTIRRYIASVHRRWLLCAEWGEEPLLVLRPSAGLHLHLLWDADDMDEGKI